MTKDIFSLVSPRRFTLDLPAEAHAASEPLANKDVGALACTLAEFSIPRIWTAVRSVKDTHNLKGRGYDLELTLNSEDTIYLEVKGSQGDSVMSGLVVSGQLEHDNLTSGKAFLLRVLNIGQKKITFHLLEYGKDYVLEQEGRWRAVRPPTT